MYFKSSQTYVRKFSDETIDLQLCDTIHNISMASTTYSDKTEVSACDELP